MSKAPTGVAQQFDSIRADYNMSRESRFIRRRVGLSSQGTGADWHYRNEWAYYRDIEKARDMDRNDSIVGQTIDRAVSNIIQDGFTLDVRTGDKGLDADLKTWWQDWSKDADQCDIEGESTFHDYERQACRGMLIDGDCVTVGLNSGHLQHFEAHSIQTETRYDNTVLGVEKNDAGRRIAYYVMRQPIESYKQDRTTKAARLETRNAAGLRLIFHVYNPKRKSQTRGVTCLAPIFELSGMFEDIQFAKLVQQQVVSCFAIFRERAYNPDIPGQTTPGYGSSSTETTSAGTRYIEDVAPGMEVVGDYGEKLQGFSPNTPNAEYFSHVRLMLQMIGVNLGLPLCLVLMDGSETNFSGWRGAVDEARKGFRANQRNVVQRFHEPCYRFKVAQWIAGDARLRAASQRSGINIFGHKWNAPTWAYIDPVGDAKGDVIRLQNGLTSRRRLHAERNGDWEEISTEQIEDNASAIIAAKKRAAIINESFPSDVPVQWRDLINLPMPNGVQMTMQDPAATMQEMEVDDDE